MLYLHHLISIKIATEKMEIVFCNFRFIILKWVLILHHSEQIRTRSHLTTFYVPSPLVQAEYSCPQVWCGFAKTTVLGWVDAAGRLLSGGMGENQGGQGLGIAIPVPPLERGGQAGTGGQASCAVNGCRLSDVRRGGSYIGRAMWRCGVEA